MSSSNIPSGTICDLFAKNDDTTCYGDRELFKSLKQKAVLELSATLNGMRTGDPNNFMRIYEKAAALRGQIATETGSEDAEEFGKFRDRDSGKSEHLTTNLQSDSYKEPNKAIKELILNHFKYIKEKDHGYSVTPKGEEKTRYTIKLISQTALSCIQGNNPLKLYQLLNQPDTHNELNERMIISEIGLTYLSTYSDILETYNALHGLPNTHSQDKFYIFLGRVQIKAEGTWTPLTRHIVVIPCNDAGEITEANKSDFRLHFIVEILHTSHQDFKLHEKTMSDLFNTIIDRNTPKADLHKLIREFEYLLHHLCYLRRGSAATNEMLLEAIRDTIYPEYVLKGNLEALAQPYLSKYFQ